MGVLTLLIAFFVFFPAIVFVLAIFALLIAAGIVTGAVSLACGIATYVVSAAVPVGFARWAGGRS